MSGSVGILTNSMLASLREEQAVSVKKVAIGQPEVWPSISGNQEAELEAKVEEIAMETIFEEEVDYDALDVLTPQEQFKRIQRDLCKIVKDSDAADFELTDEIKQKVRDFGGHIFTIGRMQRQFLTKRTARLLYSLSEIYDRKASEGDCRRLKADINVFQRYVPRTVTRELIPLAFDDDASTGLKNFILDRFFTAHPSSDLGEKRAPSTAETLESMLKRVNLDLDKVLEEPELNADVLGRVKVRIKKDLVDLAEGKVVNLHRQYHSTKSENVSEILAGKIEVSHEQDLPGAFISSVPEWKFGDVAITVDSLEAATMQDSMDHFFNAPNQFDRYDGPGLWIGYSEGLPTLKDRIIIKSGGLSEAAMETLRKSLAENGFEGCEIVTREEEETYNKYLFEQASICPKNSSGKKTLQNLYPFFPGTVEELEKVGTLDGSTNPEKLQDKTGDHFVAKKGLDGQTYSEFITNKAYEQLGISVPPVKFYDGDEPTMLAVFLEGAVNFSDASSAKQDKALSVLKEGFVADCLFANWDIPANLSNIMIDSSGKVWRVDNGGALEFRAQGERKTEEEFGSEVKELVTMRKGIYAAIKNLEIVRQIEQIIDEKEDLLKVFSGDLRDKMKSRIENLESQLPRFKRVRPQAPVRRLQSSRGAYVPPHLRKRREAEAAAREVLEDIVNAAVAKATTAALCEASTD